MAESLDILEDYDVVVNDFCSWEILDQFHDSDSDDFSFPDSADDVTTEIQVISQYLASPGSPTSSDDDDVSLVSQSLPPHRFLVEDEDEVIPQVVVTSEDMGFNAFVSSPSPSPLPVDDVISESDDLSNVEICAVVYDDYEGKYDKEEEEEEEEEEYEPGKNDLYLYDDEMIPIGVSNKLEKQRIKKSGKKGVGFVKKKYSKKMPHHSNRPGCVYGKYGLGVQFMI